MPAFTAALFAVLFFLESAYGENFCTPLPQPAPGAPAIAVSSSSQLSSAVQTAAPGTTIFLAPGTYKIGLSVNTPGITLRSATGRPADAVLDGEYEIGELIAVRGANDVTIADLTLRRANYHLVHVAGGSQRTRLYNVTFSDSREQFVKVNAENGLNADFGEIACSRFELTSAGRSYIEAHPTPGFLCYTGGIDGHSATGWHVRDSRFSGIYCTNGGLAEHCIHFWSSSADTVVERNTLINCARGIGFGLGDRGHTGGRIINNFICADSITGGPGHDCGISLESASGVLTAHNTINAAGTGWNASIDHRFPATSGVVLNNIYTSFISTRDGSQAAVRSNVQAPDSLFKSPATCELHLRSGAAGLSGIVDRGENAGITSDIDGQHRDALPDIGADETARRPAAPGSLRKIE